MNIKTIRILNLILTLVLIIANKSVFTIYIIINQILLEILNAQPLYKTHPYKWFNLIFWSYELVLVERLRHFKMNPTAEWWLNNLEHIFFALVIGFLLYILLAIFWLKKNEHRLKRIIVVAIAFNIIGLINEWNQNWMGSRPIFILIEDSKKDICMNLIGTSILFLTVLCRIAWLKKKSTA
jgi:hypothetical protein